MHEGLEQMRARRRDFLKIAAVGGLVSQSAVAQTCPVLTPANTTKFFFNVTEPPFNAVHDGMTDDTAAIQLAITTAQAAGGGIVILPAGKYLVAGTLLIDGTNYYYGVGVELHGVGPHRTDLVVPAGTTVDTIVFKNTSSGAVRSLSISSCSSRAGGSSIRLENTTNVIIDNFNTQNQFIAVRVNGGILQRIRTGYWHLGTNGTGLLIDGANAQGVPSNDTHADRIVTVGGRYGFRIRRSGAVWLHGCESVQCEKGLLIDPLPGEGVTFSFFSDCAWDTTTSHCMHLSSFGTSFIHGLTFTNCWAASSSTGNCCVIEGSGVDGVELIGHRFVNSSVGNGLYVTSSAKNVHVDASVATCCPSGSGYCFVNGANSFAIRNSHSGSYGSQGAWALPSNSWGVTVGSGCTDYMVVNNTLKGNTTGSLQDLSLGPKVVANNLV